MCIRVQIYTLCLQALTVFAVDVGPHMHMDTELVAEALRTYFLSKVRSWTSLSVSRELLEGTE